MNTREQTIFEEVGIETDHVFEHTFEECQELIRVIMHADEPDARWIWCALNEVKKLKNDEATTWATSYIFGVLSKRPELQIASDILIRGAEVLYTRRGRPRFFDNFEGYIKAYGLPGGSYPTVQNQRRADIIREAFENRDHGFMTDGRFDAVKLEVIRDMIYESEGRNNRAYEVGPEYHGPLGPTGNFYEAGLGYEEAPQLPPIERDFGHALAYQGGADADTLRSYHGLTIPALALGPGQPDSVHLLFSSDGAVATIAHQVMPRIATAITVNVLHVLNRTLQEILGQHLEAGDINVLDATTFAQALINAGHQIDPFEEHDQQGRQR